LGRKEGRKLYEGERGKKIAPGSNEDAYTETEVSSRATSAELANHSAQDRRTRENKGSWPGSCIDDESAWNAIILGYVY